MTEASFYESLRLQLKNKKPFVVYSRPIYDDIKCWLQQDDELHLTHTFQENGFVFAPYKLEKGAVLFPESKSKIHNLKTKSDQVKKKASQIHIKNNPDLEQSHTALVKKAIDRIKNDALQKVVLSRQEEVPIQTEHPLEIFKKLYNAYRQAMVYCWYHPKIGLWLGATPELLFKIEGFHLTAISLAGTQKVVNDEAPTWAYKEIEEQQIVTDYIANQLKPYVEDVNIRERNSVKAGPLWHLKTRIIAKLKESYRIKNIIEAMHPTPAVCGFPKSEAMNFIDTHEGYDRSYYTGFLGELNLTKTISRNTRRRNIENNVFKSVKTYSNFYVNLRCMKLKENQATIYVGGGITKDSSPKDEWKETVNKTKTMLKVLNQGL